MACRLREADGHADELETRLLERRSWWHHPVGKELVLFVSGQLRWQRFSRRVVEEERMNSGINPPTKATIYRTVTKLYPLHSDATTTSQHYEG